MGLKLSQVPVGTGYTLDGSTTGHTQTDTHPVTCFILCIIVGFVYVGNDLSDRLYQTSCFLLFTCSCFLVVSLANRVFLDETQQIRKLHFCTGGEDVPLFYTK